MYSKFKWCISCEFAFLTGFDVHLLKTEIYSYKANHITDITMHSQKLFSLLFCKYTSHKESSKWKLWSAITNNIDNVQSEYQRKT
jgi:hypothetical protein